MTTKFEWVMAKTLEIGDTILSESGVRGEIVGLHRIRNEKVASNPTMVFVVETLQHTFTPFSIEGKYGVWKQLNSG